MPVHWLVALAKEFYYNNEEINKPFIEDNHEADNLVRDLVNYPHAFVLACLMDSQIKAERAWLIPYRIKEILGSFDLNYLSRKTLNDFQDIFEEHKLHRFHRNKAKVFYQAIIDLQNRYQGDATNIWKGIPCSATVILRFLDFHGCGQKISNMSPNLLHRKFGIQYSSLNAIDISVDVQIRRTFGRMGFTENQAENRTIIDMARKLNPDFPGLIDPLIWEIGTKWCYENNQNCEDCIVNYNCPTAINTK
jgi:endonuclease III